MLSPGYFIVTLLIIFERKYLVSIYYSQIVFVCSVCVYVWIDLLEMSHDFCHIRPILSKSSIGYFFATATERQKYEKYTYKISTQ